MLDQINQVTERLYSQVSSSINPMIMRIGTVPEIEEVPQKIRDHWAPPTYEHPFEWLPKNIYFSTKDGANPGYWTFDLFPQSKGPFAALVDPLIEEIVLRFGTRAGKTSIVTAFACWMLDNDPGQLQFTAPTENDAHDHFKTKLEPMILRSAKIRHLLPPRSERNMSRLDMTKAWIWYGWLGAPGTLSARAIRYMIITEVNLGGFTLTNREGDPIAMARDRLKDAVRRKIIYEGKPIEKGVCRLEKLIGESDDRSWNFRCPECQNYQPYEEGDKDTEYGLHWEKGLKGSDPEIARKTAFYVCKFCGAKLTQHEKHLMNRNGLWIRSNEIIQKDPTITAPSTYLGCDFPAGYRVDNQHETGNRIAGFTQSSLASNIVTFGEYAYELIRAYQSNEPRKIQAFVNGWRTMAYETGVRAITVEEIMRHVYEGCLLGTVPFNTNSVIVCAADVQLDRIYFICRAYTYGATSMLVDYGMISNGGMPGDDLKKLENYLASTFYSNPQGAKYPISFLVIDAGYSGRKTEINDFCWRRYPHAAPAIGRPFDGFSSAMTEIVLPSKMPKYTAGEKSMELWKIGFQASNTQFFDGVLNTAIDKPGCWYVPEDVGKDYIEHLLAVKRTRKKQNTTLSNFFLWEQISPMDHYLDCERMAMAFSIIQGYSRVGEGDET